MCLMFQSVDDFLKCDHSKSSYWAVLSCDAVYYAVQGGSHFWVLGSKSLSVTIQMKATEQYFPVVLFITLYKVVLSFESLDQNPKVWPFKWKLLSSTFLWCCLLRCTRWFYLLSPWIKILKCDHSNESYRATKTSHLYFSIPLSDHVLFLFNLML